mmetsp:Transcript_1242/g.3504  ORF Transcript_1242/g.3504 Transcript_1242/m.3504 type:complete len:361 (-) Transcript_1242:1237-2319(-)
MRLEQAVRGHPVAVDDSEPAGIQGSHAGRQIVQRTTPVRHDQPACGVADQLAVGRQVGQQRHTAVGHGFQHRHRHRIALRQAQEPGRAGVVRGLLAGVQPADEADLACQAAGRHVGLQASAQRAVVGHHQLGLGLRGRNAGEGIEHALGLVDRLQAPVREAKPGLLLGVLLGQRLQAEGEGHHLARAQRPHALGHVQRVRGRHGAAAQHLLRQPAPARTALGRDEDVAAPGRAGDARAQPPARLGGPGQRTVRGQVVGMQPVGIGVGQPGADLGQLLEQRDIAATVVGCGVERQPARIGQQLVELRQEAARRDRMQLHPRLQRARPLQQVGALAIADQHQLQPAGERTQAHAGSSPAQAW